MRIFQSFRTPAICLALLGIVGALTGCAGMAELFGPPPAEQRRVVYYPQPAPPAPTPAAAPAPQIASAPATTPAPAAAVVISQPPGEPTTPPANVATPPAPQVVYVPQWPTTAPTTAPAAADAGLAAIQSVLVTFGPLGAAAATLLGAGAWWLRGRYWSNRDMSEARTMIAPPTTPNA